MFPVTDSSRTIVNCLVQSARLAGVDLLVNHGVEKVTRKDISGFELVLSTGGRSDADALC